MRSQRPEDKPKRQNRRLNSTLARTALTWQNTPTGTHRSTFPQFRAYGGGACESNTPGRLFTPHYGFEVRTEPTLSDSVRSISAQSRKPAARSRAVSNIRHQCVRRMHSAHAATAGLRAALGERHPWRQPTPTSDARFDDRSP